MVNERNDPARNLLLDLILEELTDMNKGLASPLFKLYYFAKRTDNKKLAAFLDKEINGYSPEDELPTYRKGPAIVLAVFKFGYNYEYKEEQEIPVSMFEENVRDFFTTTNLREGISVLEGMAIDPKKDQYIAKPLPLELVIAVVQPILSKLLKYTNWVATGADVRGNSNLLLQACNAVRTKMIDFVHEISTEFGYNIKIDEYQQHKSKNNQTINTFMKTTIHNTGDGNLINTGNQAKIDASIKIKKGDFGALNEELKKHGIDQEDIQELNKILENEEPNRENNQLGPKSASWVGNIISKSLSGIGKIGTGVTANLFASLIKSYYGMPS